MTPFKLYDELPIMKTANRSCVDLLHWLLPDIRSVEQLLISDLSVWWILCVSFIQRGYRGVWPQTRKPHLSFLMTVGLHFTVTLGLDISVIGFKESLLMRNRKTKPSFYLSIYFFLQFPCTHRYSLLSSCVVGLTVGIKTNALCKCDSQNIHETLEPRTNPFGPPHDKIMR